MKEYLENVRCVAPLIHNITNYVTANDVANVLLACGASPIMADEEAGVEEIKYKNRISRDGAVWKLVGLITRRS